MVKWRTKIVRDLVSVIASPSIMCREADADVDDPLRYPDEAWLAALVSRSRAWLSVIDLKPALVTDFITGFPRASFSVSRLGRYFALLLEFWIRYCPALQIAASGDPASSEARHRFITWSGRVIVAHQVAREAGFGIVGALKFLFLTQVDKQSALGWLHWEASYKIFVAAPAPLGAHGLHSFVGPFLHETMGMRVGTARRKLALSSAPVVTRWLARRRAHALAVASRFLRVDVDVLSGGRGVDDTRRRAPLVKSQCVLKGLICYPMERFLRNGAGAAPLPGCINPGHHRGWWAATPALLVSGLAPSRAERFAAHAAAYSADAESDAESDEGHGGAAVEHRWANLPKLHWISSVETRARDALPGDESIGLEPVPLLDDDALVSLLRQVGETDVTAVLVAELRRVGRGWVEVSRGFVYIDAAAEWDPLPIITRSLEAHSVAVPPPLTPPAARFADCAEIEDRDFVLPASAAASLVDAPLDGGDGVAQLEALVDAAVLEHEANRAACSNAVRKGGPWRRRKQHPPVPAAAQEHSAQRALAATLRFHARGGAVLVALLAAWSARARAADGVGAREACIKRQRVAGHILFSVLQDVCRLYSSYDITPRFGASTQPFPWCSASQRAAPGRLVVTEADLAAAARLARGLFVSPATAEAAEDVFLCPSLLNRAGLALAGGFCAVEEWVAFDARRRELLGIALEPLHAAVATRRDTIADVAAGEAAGAGAGAGAAAAAGAAAGAAAASPAPPAGDAASGGCRAAAKPAAPARRGATDVWSDALRAPCAPSAAMGAALVARWVLTRGSSIESVCSLLKFAGVRFASRDVERVAQYALNANEAQVAEVAAAYLPLLDAQRDDRWRLITSSVDGALQRGLRSAKACKKALASRAKSLRSAPRGSAAGAADTKARLTLAREAAESADADEALPTLALLAGDVPPAVVETEAQLRAATAQLAECVAAERAVAAGDIVVVSLDCEWEPRSSSGARTDPDVQTVQLCCSPIRSGGGSGSDSRGDADAAAPVPMRLAFVLDMQALVTSGDSRPVAIAALSALFGLIFGPDVVLVGFGLRGDLVQLLSSTWAGEIASIELPLSIPHTIDLQLAVAIDHGAAHEKGRPVLRAASAEGSGGGDRFSLSALVRRVLRRKMDKTEQVSNWSARPLTVGQRRYAALDAEALVRVVHALTSTRSAARGSATAAVRAAAACLDVATTEIALGSADVLASMRALGLKHALDAPFLEFTDAASAGAVGGGAASPALLAQTAAQASALVARALGRDPAEALPAVRLCKTLGLVVAARWTVVASGAAGCAAGTTACAQRTALPPPAQCCVACVVAMSQRLSMERVACVMRARLCAATADDADSAGCGCGCERRLDVRVRMVSRRALVARFGYRVGGLGPIGLRDASTTVLIDTAVASAGQILLLGAGQPGLVFCSSASELARCGVAAVAQIAAEEPADGGAARRGNRGIAGLAGMHLRPSMPGS